MAHSMTDKGLKFQHKKQYGKAMQCYEKALQQRPNDTVALVNTAIVLHHLKQHNKGLRYIDKAISIEKNNPDFLLYKAQLLHKKLEFEAALAYYKKSLAIKSPTALNLFHMGCCYQAIGLNEKAIESYKKAFSMKPQAIFAYNAAKLYHFLGAKSPAEKHYLQALRLEPRSVDILFSLGELYKTSYPHQAKDYFDALLTINPNYEKAKTALFFVNLSLYNWKNYQQKVLETKKLVEKSIKNNQRIPIAAFDIICLPEANNLQYKVGKRISAELEKSVSKRRSYEFKHLQQSASPLKIGFISSNIGSHPLSYVINKLFLHFNSEKITTYVYSHGRHDNSEYRTNIKNSCDYFCDCYQWDNTTIADKIYKDSIQILVDLNGLLSFNRLSVLALRPAPIQVRYLGYSGSTGANFIDYIIANNTVIPQENYQYYSEKLVALPECHSATDDQQLIATERCKRCDYGLPEDKFILCSMNTPYKLSPDVFDCWLAILNSCDKTILWILIADDKAKDTLLDYAKKRGVTADRFYFAKRMTVREKHLARLSQADLIVDSFVVNGLATSIDALWAEVPVIRVIVKNCVRNSIVKRQLHRHYHSTKFCFLPYYPL